MDTSVTDSRRTQRAIRNAAHLLAGRVSTLVVLAISAVVIPGTMGAEAYGLYASVIAVAVILEVMTSGGLQMAELKFVAPAWQLGDRERALSFASTIWLSRLALSVLSGALAIPWLLSTGHFPSLLVVGLLGLYVLLRSAFEVTRHLLLSVDRPGRMAWLEVGRALLILLLVIAAFPLGGLDAVFQGLPLVQGLLFAVAAYGLLSAIPLRIRHFDWGVLRSVARYTGFAWIGVVAWYCPSQFAVYAAANWVSLEEAAILAFTVQVYAVLQTLLTAASTSILPVLSEMFDSSEDETLGRWTDVILRWVAFLTTSFLLSWAVAGDQLARLLPAEFARIHETGTLMLGALVFMACGSVGNGLLYAAGRSGAASTNRLIFAVLAVGGTSALALSRGTTTAIEMTAVFLVAGAAFCVQATAYARQRLRLRLPWVAGLRLIAPGILAWPLATWEAGLVVKVAVLLLGLGAYVGYVLLSRLVQVDEIRRLRAFVRR